LNTSASDEEQPSDDRGEHDDDPKFHRSRTKSKRRAVATMALGPSLAVVRV